MRPGGKSNGESPFFETPNLSFEERVGNVAEAKANKTMHLPSMEELFGSDDDEVYPPEPSPFTHQDAARITQGLLLTSSPMAKSQKHAGPSLAALDPSGPKATIR